MAKLNVNIDLVARIRELRKTRYPDLLEAARIVEAAGADGITVHLRRDRRHIQDADLPALKKIIRTRLNLEMANTSEMVGIALKVKPEMVTLVPERATEVTTTGGLDVVKHKQSIARTIAKLHRAGIHPSVFIDPDPAQIEASKACGARSVELCTAEYADATTKREQDRHFRALKQAAALTRKLGLGLNLGHGLDYDNTARLAAIPGLEDFNTGHSIICHSVFVGLATAVKQMRRLVRGK